MAVYCTKYMPQIKKSVSRIQIRFLLRQMVGIFMVKPKSGVRG